MQHLSALLNIVYAQICHPREGGIQVEYTLIVDF